MKTSTMRTEKALTPETLKTMRVLVVGLARSGLAAGRVLTDMGVYVKATDSKPASALEREAADLRKRGVELELGRNSIEFARDCDLVIVSPGVPLDIPLIRWAYTEGRPVISEVELAYCITDARFIAVTGTNGKSTTVSLLGAIFRAATAKTKVGGNIGDPISALVRGLGDDWTAVIELSSYQLDTCVSFRPEVGVLLNITPDHLNRYSSYEAYIQSKARLFANQTEQDFAVVNFDDKDSLKAVGDAVSRKLFFSLKEEVREGAFVRDGQIVIRVNGKESTVFRKDDLRIRGPHNLANSLAATLAASAAGIEPEAIRGAVRSFPGLEHRLEHVGTIAGVEFINDSKATNLDSLRCALETADRPVVLIAGGRDKGGDWTEIGGLVAETVTGIVAIGEAREKIREAFSGLVEVEKADSLGDAVEKAFRMATNGESVMLSPGCASFDMFTDFEHRGHEFKLAVMRLKRERQGRSDG
jgi:UDP-N-acetylmuramoylalanine--D-glutamate ligase